MASASNLTGLNLKALLISDKLKILKKYSEGCTAKKEIAKELGIPLSTLRTVLKNKSEMEENRLLGGSKRQKVKHGKYVGLEKFLLELFQ